MTSSFALDAFVATTCQRARGMYQECEENSKSGKTPVQSALAALGPRNRRRSEEGNPAACAGWEAPALGSRAQSATAPFAGGLHRSVDEKTVVHQNR